MYGGCYLAGCVCVNSHPSLQDTHRGRRTAHQLTGRVVCTCLHHQPGLFKGYNVPYTILHSLYPFARMSVCLSLCAPSRRPRWMPAPARGLCWGRSWTWRGESDAPTRTGWHAPASQPEGDCIAFTTGSASTLRHAIGACVSVCLHADGAGT